MTPAKAKREISGVFGGLAVGDRFPIRVMGVINLTKNSFYSGSVREGKRQIIESAMEMERAGADAIDLGARSTAPYRTYDIPEEVETSLIKNAMKALHGKIRIPISIDTTRIAPAKVGITEGARILNDVHGLHQKDGRKLAELVSSHELSLILTAHEIRQRKGPPMDRVTSSLSQSLRIASEASVDRKKTTLDPGIGFFSDRLVSNVDWNSTVIANLDELRKFSLPICIGISRKKFIGTIAGDSPAENRLFGSLSATGIAIYNGCHIVRTHDVGETLQAVRVAYEIRLRQKVKAVF